MNGQSTAAKPTMIATISNIMTGQLAWFEVLFSSDSIALSPFGSRFGDLLYIF
jgi:hypothetical protein